MGEKRIILIILDGLGIGNAKDAHLYDDEGANTFLSIVKSNPQRLDNLEMIGFGHFIEDGIMKKAPDAVIGIAQPMSKGKDSTTGHWEIAGLIVERPFPLYPEGFPDRIIAPFRERIGRDILGNYSASGIKIIEDLGDEHIRTGYPIVYTSADSVFQIACCEETVKLDTLYDWCMIARELLQGEDRIARVIARPFIRKNDGRFERTPNRRDFSVKPFNETVLDIAKGAGIPVFGIGKIDDLFAGCGLTNSIHTGSNEEGILRTLEIMGTLGEGIIMTNLVDFDTKYGHRRDIEGFHKALSEFDSYIPKIISELKKEDILILTADHGNDPAFQGSDHTRENVPIVIYGHCIKRPVNIGLRDSFADIGRTIADYFNLRETSAGKSFLKLILKEVA